MYITNEYTVLIGEKDNITIYPNKEFAPFEGEYTVSNFARVTDLDTKEWFNLMPGQKLNGLGKVKKKISRKKKVEVDGK